MSHIGRNIANARNSTMPKRKDRSMGSRAVVRFLMALSTSWS